MKPGIRSTVNDVGRSIRFSGFGFLSDFVIRISSRLSDRLESSACCGAPEDPVAVIESVQVVRVETVAEICPKFHRPGRGGMGDASRDGAKTVSVFPGGLGALLKFLDG